MIILENVFFGFWHVLGDFFILCLAVSIMFSVFFAIFDLFIPR